MADVGEMYSHFFRNFLYSQFLTFSKFSQKAADELGFELVVLDSRDSGDAQIKNAEDLISRKVDGLIFVAYWSTGNRILVIHTYDDWFRNPSESLDMPEMERLYDDLGDSVKTEAAIRGLGGSYIRIGPADSAPRIVRAIGRGKT